MKEVSRFGSHREYYNGVTLHHCKLQFEISKHLTPLLMSVSQCTVARVRNASRYEYIPLKPTIRATVEYVSGKCWHMSLYY